jgi:hypothetical protein
MTRRKNLDSRTCAHHPSIMTRSCAEKVWDWCFDEKFLMAEIDLPEITPQQHRTNPVHALTCARLLARFSHANQMKFFVAKFRFFGKGGCLLFWTLFMSRPGQISHATSRRWRSYSSCSGARLTCAPHDLSLTRVTTFHRGSA